MAGYWKHIVALLAFTQAALALKNPLIPGWNPDPHVLRVNDTYYVAVSSFLAFPGVPIYSSKDLSNWELVSHAIDDPFKMPLFGTKTDNGIWAPSLSYIDGRFYMTSMTVWGSDPNYRVYPRMFWVSSPDLKSWSDVVWGEPYGIDPHLWQDPNTGKKYLSCMGLNNNWDRLWGISQCEVDLQSGKCLGRYGRTWNGTLPVVPSARPEGPKLFYREPYYYLIAAEGGTGEGHRVTIARSNGPMGPWTSAPNNPLLYNGANLTLSVGNTGHASFSNTPDGRWFTTFLARRYVGSESPLGRETFFAPVEWRQDGWPVVNGGQSVRLSQEYDYGPTLQYPPAPFEDKFEGSELASYWYQLRSPYTKNFELQDDGVVFNPNPYALGDRDTPAAIMRKQKSVNMTFEATLLPTNKALGREQSVGVSMYSSESTHHDVTVRGCYNSTGQCITAEWAVRLPGPASPTTRPQIKEYRISPTTIPANTKLYIESTPGRYRMGYSINTNTVTWVHEFPFQDMQVGFDGAMLTLFASGNSNPWPFDGPRVGFSKVREVYYNEGFRDVK